MIRILNLVPGATVARVLYYCYIENSATWVLYISASIALLKSICNFVSWNKNDRAFFTETKLHIQKCNGLENIENPNRTLEA
jgi:hypothetical protein